MISGKNPQKSVYTSSVSGAVHTLISLLHNSNNFTPMFARRSLSFFTPFVNRCLPDNGWRSQQKRVTGLNKIQYIKSVQLCLKFKVAFKWLEINNGNISCCSVQSIIDKCRLFCLDSTRQKIFHQNSKGEASIQNLVKLYTILFTHLHHWCEDGTLTSKYFAKLKI